MVPSSTIEVPRNQVPSRDQLRNSPLWDKRSFNEVINDPRSSQIVRIGGGVTSGGGGYSSSESNQAGLQAQQKALEMQNQQKLAQEEAAKQAQARAEIERRNAGVYVNEQQAQQYEAAKQNLSTQIPTAAQIAARPEAARIVSQYRGKNVYLQPKAESLISLKEVIVQDKYANTATPTTKVVVVDSSGNIVRDATQKEISEAGGRNGMLPRTTSVSTPTGFLNRYSQKVSEARSKTVTKEYRGQGDIGVQLLGAGLGAATSAIGTLQFGKSLLTEPKSTFIGLGKGVYSVGERVVTGAGFPEVSRIINEEPGFATGFVAAEYATGKGMGAVGEFTYTKVSPQLAKLLPNVKTVETTSIGERLIKDIEILPGQKIDIGLIPERGAKLDVNVGKIIKETNIPFKSNPHIPTLPDEFKAVVQGAKESGGIVSGSFAQKVLLKEEFTRPWKDIDVITTNVERTTKAVKASNKLLSSENKLITDSPLGRFNIEKVSYKGKQIADIDPIKFAEEGLIEKKGILNSIIVVDDVAFINPNIRLGAKLTQFARGKATPKVLTDIKLLTGGKIDIDLGKATLTGPYGYTKAELASYIGKTGPVTTSARDLFKFLERQRIIEDIGGEGYGLFATPFDIKTGQAITRITRLGVDEAPKATFIDILSGDVSFKKGKPQIVVFPDETIGKDFKVPFKSSELEVNLKPGRGIGGYKVGRAIINGKKVDIISGKIFPEGYAVPKGKLGGLKSAIRDLISEKKGGSAIPKYKEITYNNKPFYSPYKLAPYSKLFSSKSSDISLMKYSRGISSNLLTSKRISSPSYGKSVSGKISTISSSKYLKEPSYSISPSKSYKDIAYYKEPVIPPYYPPIKKRRYSLSPFINGSESENKKLSRRKLGFDLFVRRNKKFMLEGTGLSEISAKNLGVRKVFKDLSASFALRPSSSPGRDLDLPNLFGRYKSKFRKPTRKSSLYRSGLRDIYVTRQSGQSGRLFSRDERFLISQRRKKR